MTTNTSFKLDPNGRPYIEKTPGERLIYGLDLEAWQDSAGDTVTTATVTSGGTLIVGEGSGPLSSGAASVGAGVVTSFIGGGAVGEYAPVTFDWQTAGGQTGSRTIWLRIVAARP